MPLYEFKCENCNTVIEEIVSMKTRDIPLQKVCEECQIETTYIRKEITNVSEAVFKGTGFYATDYR